MINKLVMYCDYRSNGCEQKLVLEIYDAHIQKCDFKLLQCPNVGCNVSLLRKDLSQHVNNVCEFREVTCNKGCHLKIPINDLNFHNCMIALKQKSEKQQKLIEEYLKKIQELVSLKDLLKKKVENLLRNIDRSTPLRGESMSGLFSSYEEDEDITPISVVPRGGDNTDARLSVISNYFEFYANAVDRITSEVSHIQNEANIIFNSEFNSTSNNNSLSLLQDDGRTQPNVESRRAQRRNDDVSASRSTFGSQMQESLDTMNRDRYSLPVSSYLSMNLDQEASVRAESISPSIAAETVSGSTGTDDGYTLTDRELDVSYVADSEDGNNSAAEYNYDNVSDNGIFESDEDDEEDDDDDDDYDDVPSDVSSSIQSSLLANVHSESAVDEADTSNNLRNLYEESAELWSEHHSNANQSTENANDHRSETVPESDNVSVNAVDGDSFLQRSEENYLSSNYISSPSVTSVQYSPVLSSTPFHDSDSEIYEHNVVMFSDLSDDEANRDVELVLDTGVTFPSSAAENTARRTSSNNTHSENSRILSEEDGDGSDEDGDDDNESNTLYRLAVSDYPSSPAEDDDEEDNNNNNNNANHIVCVLESSNSAHPVENSITNNTENTEVNEVSITHICTSNKSAPNNNSSVEHLERPSSQTAMYQNRQRYIEMNSEPVAISGQHNLTRFLQAEKESLRFSQHVLFDNTETDCPASSVSIKIEPNQDIGRMSSSSEITDVHKTILSTRASYNSRVTQGYLQVNSAGTGEPKTFNERLMQTDISSHYTSSSQRALSSVHVNRCPKRSNSSSTETRTLGKRRRTRDYSNYNSSSQTIPTAAIRNRVDLSVINVRESPGQSLPKRHRCNRYPATVSTPTVPTTAIVTPSITSNTLPAAACTYSPRLMLNSGRQSVSSSGGRTRRSQRRSTREWQLNIQPDANDIRVVEERTLSSVSATDTAVGGSQTFRDRRHSHQSEYTMEQADSDDASYEPSDSYSDTDGQETDGSYEVLVPKSISQLLEEYDSEETDESWTVDMA